MTYKNWAIKLIVSLLVIVGGIGGFNYWMDPLWMYGGAHDFNDAQSAINERQQKTNRIIFQPFSPDTLLLGSSRATYINQHDFEGMDVYNYSVSNLSVQEYESFIEVAKANSDREIKTVILGIDFFKSSLAESKQKISILPYAQTLEEPSARWKNLISYDLTQYSIDNFKASLKDKPIYVRTYDRHNVATTITLSKEQADAQLETKVEKFRDTFYGNYEYNPEYKQILQNVKDKNPDTRFIVFTSPISEPLFKELVDAGAYPHYEKWLRELVEVYGEVYHFMDINTVTKDTANFFDGHHYYPEVGTMIAHRISMENSADVPQDFGKIINKENIDEFFNESKK